MKSPRIRHDFTSLLACAMLSLGLCFVDVNVLAQQPQIVEQTIVPPNFSGETTRSEESCHCRSTAGGYPCATGCPKCMVGVDCADGCGGEARWSDIKPMNFGAYGPGGYAGPARFAHLNVYRLRPGDQLQVIYLITRRQESGEYRLAPGDEILIESVADSDLTRGTLERGLLIQPDGTITVRLLGQVYAAGLTVPQLRDVLEEKIQTLVRRPDHRCDSGQDE